VVMAAICRASAGKTGGSPPGISPLVQTPDHPTCFSASNGLLRADSDWETDKRFFPDLPPGNQPTVYSVLCTYDDAVQRNGKFSSLL
jgi:hypothetical protein